MTWEIVKTEVLDVLDHPNADRLSLVKVMGYTSISAKLEDGSHRYNVGDTVIYIPEASVLNGKLLYTLGFWDDDRGKGTLAGSKGNRVKATKLRGVVSQGLILPESALDGMSVDDWVKYNKIYKYEPAIPSHLKNGITKVSEGTISYDVKHGQKEVDLFDADDQVVVTEKIHGTLLMFGFYKTEDGVERIISSKGLAKNGFRISEESTHNIYVRMAAPFLDRREEDFAKHALVGEKFLFIGEIYGQGVQDLHYSQQAPALRIFDVFRYVPDVGGRYLDYDVASKCAQVSGLEWVPVLYRGSFGELDIPAYRDGNSSLDETTVREGVVVRTVHEVPHNRKCAKFVSPDYLTRRGGTEYN